MRLLLALIWAEPLHAHGLGEAEARHQYGRFPGGRGTRTSQARIAIRSPPGRRWWKPPSARRRTTRAACSSCRGRCAPPARARSGASGCAPPARPGARPLGELNGPIETHLQGYAREGRRHLDRALELDPDHAWAHGALGMWHLEILQHAGPALGGELYGATAEKGLRALRPCARVGAREHRAALWLRVLLLAVGRGAYGRPAAELLAAASRCWRFLRLRADQPRKPSP